MKKSFKISFVLIVGICFWFGISENYLSKHHSLFTQYDIENQQSSSNKEAHQNIFSIEEEDFQNDTFNNLQETYCFKLFYYQKYFTSELDFPLAFPFIIWQPPRIS